MEYTEVLTSGPKPLPILSEAVHLIISTPLLLYVLP